MTTQASSPSQEIVPENEQRADSGSPGDRIGQDGQEPDPVNSLGLAELHAMEGAYRALESLEEAGRNRAILWLAEALNVHAFQQSTRSAGLPTVTMQNPTVMPPNHELHVTPREFISQKRPESLVERVACLAYYLDRYRGISHFRTSDIVALNTEAAAHKFGNPSRDVDNADRHNGYLVSAGNGRKQLTVRGETVVAALPDRESVRAALKDHPHKARRSSSSAKKTNTHSNGEL